MQAASQDDAVPEPCRALAGLFRDLPDLRFPGVDGQTLEESIAAVEERQQRVAAAEAALKNARQDLESAQGGLMAASRRAQAYALVYADDQPELREQLEKIRLGGPRRAPRKRNKPRTDEVDRAKPEKRKGEKSKDGPAKAA